MRTSVVNPKHWTLLFWFCAQERRDIAPVDPRAAVLPTRTGELRSTCEAVKVSPEKAPCQSDRQTRQPPSPLYIARQHSPCMGVVMASILPVAT